jgi:hypothetical protein
MIQYPCDIMTEYIMKLQINCYFFKWLEVLILIMVLSLSSPQTLSLILICMKSSKMFLKYIFPLYLCKFILRGWLHWNYHHIFIPLRHFLFSCESQFADQWPIPILDILSSSEKVRVATSCIPIWIYLNSIFGRRKKCNDLQQSNLMQESQEEEKSEYWKGNWIFQKRSQLKQITNVL